MHPLWPGAARRIVEALGVQPGELIQVREGTGRWDVFQAITLAVELAGATPSIEILTAPYLHQLWNEAPLAYLAHWDQHRRNWMEQYQRVLRLQGGEPNVGEVRQEGFQAWLEAIHRLTQREEERRLPFLVVAIPTEPRAESAGLTLAELEEVLLPALAAPVAELRAANQRALAAIAGGGRFAICTGDDHLLTLHQGNRQWHEDDGLLDEEDWASGAFVGNLPSGDIYTTVLEEASEGELWLPVMGEAQDVLLHFRGGRIVAVEAASGGESLDALFARHTGEPRCISHLGIGLNPYLHKPIGWTLVDEHIYGQLYFALGENRYMGGQNASSLNIDFIIPKATFLVDGRMIVEDGGLLVRSQPYASHEPPARKPPSMVMVAPVI